MEWVIRLLDALRRRKTLKLTKREYEIFLREKEDSQKHAMPSEIRGDLSYKYGAVGASSSVVDAQFDPNSIEEARIAGENQAYQEEAGK